MSNSVKIKTALISVYHKDKLEPIVKKLGELGIRLISTGGTKSTIEKMGQNVTSVEDLTSYPSILGGRVKTLHPKIFGGILARRELPSDQTELNQYEIPAIDLVLVDLYPFEETVASGANKASIIEKIDIGGISLIRAAAKNYKDVLVVSGRQQYESLLDLLNEKGGETSLDDRMYYAAEAFNVSSHYDTQIFNYFNTEAQIPAYKISEIQGRELRYGENPHQKGVYFGDFDAMFDKIHGKEISYNNLLDIDAAVQLISEFNDTSFVVLKHNNACGLASRSKLLDAWKDALAGDPISAFGGILITNSKLNHETAVEINKLFFEAIIAPGYDEDALEVLKQKKNRIILIQKEVKLAEKLHRSVLNGTLVQDKDLKTETVNDMKTVTKKTPSDNELADMAFANIVVKHSKSNSIVLAKDNQLLASGVGQTSRIDALKHAIEKAKGFGFDLNGAVMASDAFFPFADSVEIAGKAGITAVIQPGGSVRDQESIDYCNDHNIAMVFTGTRHFKH
jgi:phosphoribosylaminoimidazolecarboxamide formyltransferase/IMP cyclohydrolase